MSKILFLLIALLILTLGMAFNGHAFHQGIKMLALHFHIYANYYIYVVLCLMRFVAFYQFIHRIG